ncbi:hypothetical protein [Candidatus Lokiarchaeum ossiferum]|uniref:hypothetical protein n=1 Tax=Candidatus Lokiarchaeum ossiferum TaxID=2951803 RepID=UPI00352F7808
MDKGTLYVLVAGISAILLIIGSILVKKILNRRFFEQLKSKDDIEPFLLDLDDNFDNWDNSIESKAGKKL